MLKLIPLLLALSSYPLMGKSFPITWGANTIDAGGSNGGPALQIDGGAATLYSDPINLVGITGNFVSSVSVVCATPQAATSGMIWLQISNDGVQWAIASATPATIDGGAAGNTVNAATIQFSANQAPALIRVEYIGVATLTTAGPLECSAVVERL